MIYSTIARFKLAACVIFEREKESSSRSRGAALSVLLQPTCTRGSDGTLASLNLLHTYLPLTFTASRIKIDVQPRQVSALFFPAVVVHTGPSRDTEQYWIHNSRWYSYTSSRTPYPNSTQPSSFVTSRSNSDSPQDAK